jgi:glycosyltransferase involved in cell wall biosynthesis
MTHLGLLDYAATGELYRSCDIGMALTVSRHPSYLPLELMACGVPVIAFDNPWGHWLLQHNENSWLTERTADGLVDSIVRLVRDQVTRRRLAENAAKVIDARHADWDTALSGIYAYMSDPEGWSGD